MSRTNPLAAAYVEWGTKASFCMQHPPPHLAEEPMDSFEEYELGAIDTEDSVFRDALRDGEDL